MIEHNYGNNEILDFDKISNIEAVINCFSKEYSFNIGSELFPTLTSEQQKLWKKEIEYAVKAGAEYGIELLQNKCCKVN
jgi:hypothetical protein